MKRWVILGWLMLPLCCCSPKQASEHTIELGVMTGNGYRIRCLFRPMSFYVNEVMRQHDVDRERAEEAVVRRYGNVWHFIVDIAPLNGTAADNLESFRHETRGDYSSMVQDMAFGKGRCVFLVDSEQPSDTVYALDYLYNRNMNLRDNSTFLFAFDRTQITSCRRLREYSLVVRDFGANAGTIICDLKDLPNEG
jgi:hypothetical protein